ncbi:E3 ubiquitin-protein ligase RNF216-like isoform X1 [Onthophagus taurus]|uniref:E3 ubiquitin-protein ligase RNF216-like isoform X1 n=1 Tax=Onthophagus taurus TaxID=166361 RepID=UPI0039BDE3C7
MEDFDKSKDLFQYAQDLINLGVIKNQDDYLKFFQSNSLVGEELEIAQKLVNDHCFGRGNEEIMFEDYELNEVEALCRIFPQCTSTNINKIYKMINGNGHNKMQTILSVLSMYTKMHLENHLVQKNPSTSNIPDSGIQDNGVRDNDIQENGLDYLFNSSPPAMWSSYGVNPNINNFNDGNSVTSSVMQPSCSTYRSNFYDFSTKSTPSATIVRPETSTNVNQSMSPNRFVDFPFNRTEQIGKVTCKPMESLVQPQSDDFKCSSSCNEVTDFLERFSDGNEEFINNQMDVETNFQANKGQTDGLGILRQPVFYHPKPQENREYIASSSTETMPYSKSTGTKHKPLDFVRHRETRSNENKKQKLDRIFPNERNYDAIISDVNSDSDEEIDYIRETNEKCRKLCRKRCKCTQRKHKAILKPARFQPDNEPIDLSDYAEINEDLLSDLDNDDEEIGAVALPAKTCKRGNKSKSSYCSKLSSHIMEMFPDACPTYIKDLCIGKSKNEQHIGQILEIIFNDPNYPKRSRKSPSPIAEMDLETQTQLLKDIFPDADPTYLESQALIYLSEPDGLSEFISSHLEKRNYPTKKEYLRRQQLNAQVRQYTTEFNVDNFLDIIKDPETYFKDLSRRTRSDNQVERHLCGLVLKNLYSRVAIRDMPPSLYEQNLIIAAEHLNNVKTMKTVRRPVYVDLSALQNIPLLQEIAYLTNRAAILKRVEDKKHQETLEREEAKKNGLMLTCACCYDDEVMPKDCVMCENGCHFCKRCVETSVQIAFNEGKSDFPCLAGCEVNFTIKMLKDALVPKFFSKVAQRQQLQEVKAAGIDDVVTCPFCDFATIPAPGDKIFKCLNTECMKESCRECKEPSHVPLRCDEIEKDDDVKKRIYIENKMTEALVRVCYKCGLKFIKEDGCNKMTCSCGASMCYVCLAPVKDYKHFNGQGGDQFHLCPLYSDTNTLHENQVMQGAEMAKEELGIAKDDKLKVDPLEDVHQHYDQRRSLAPPPLPGIHDVEVDPQARFHMVVNIVGHGVRPHMIRINQNRQYQNRRGHHRH